MEDVLKTYARGYDDGTVLVCMDGTPEQQTRETRTPLPTRPGQPAAYGFGYGRNGTANLFMVYAPSTPGAMWRSPTAARSGTSPGSPWTWPTSTCPAGGSCP